MQTSIFVESLSKRGRQFLHSHRESIRTREEWVDRFCDELGNWLTPVQRGCIAFGRRPDLKARLAAL